MIFFIGILGVPVAYLAVLVTLLVRRQPRGVVVSVLFFAVSVATGIWAIWQSRASTAGIALLGLPLLGALGGLLGLFFGRYRSSAEWVRRVGAWTALAGALLLVAFNIAQGLQTKSKNRASDDKWAAQRAEIGRDRDLIATALKENPGRQGAWLDSSVRARMNDRAFLLAAIPNDSMPAGLLDTLASSLDLGVALEAVRNPNTRAETLERVYRTKSYPDYFFQALAGHRNTPSGVLLELYHQPGIVTRLAIWFAGNPSSPKEILGDLARTATDKSVIGALLENPALDCGTLSQLAVNLMKTQNRDADNPNVMRLNERLPTICRNTTK